MKKLAMLFLAIAVFFLSPCLPAFAGGDDPTINEAKKLWEWNKKYEAVDCLESVISDNFQNKKAYYLLIQYSLKLNLRDKAVKAIEPPPIQKKYGKKVAVWFANEAKELLDSNQEKAKDLYELAFKLNPALRAPIVAQLFVEGKSNPKKYFPLVISLEPRQRVACADYLMDLSNKSKDEATKMGHMKTAAETDPNRYGDKYQINASTLGQKYLALAWKNACWINKQDIAKKYENLARKYLGDGPVNKKFHVEVHGPGSYPIFKISTNMITPNWQKITNETVYKFGATKSNFDLYFEDGTKIEVRKSSDIPKHFKEKKFKIAAPFEKVFVGIKILKYSHENLAKLRST